MQCQETCWMATDTINLPNEGGMQGCNCKCKGTESIQNLCPLLPLLCLNAFSLGNQRWPTSGPGGYIAPAASGVPTASQRGAESEVAHKWAGWVHNPCCLGGPHRFTTGGRIRGGPQVGKVAT